MTRRSRESDERPVRRRGSDERAVRQQGRRLSAVCAALLLAAIALEGAGRLPWFTAGVDAVGRGTVTVTAKGADLVTALTAVALFALAGVAAAVALAGPSRRVLGGLVAAAGVGVGVAVVRVLVSPPTPADLAALPGAPAGGTAVAGSALPHVGPLVAMLGALLLVLAGVVLAVREPRLPRLGGRYATRAAAREAATDPDRADPDRAAWDALDAGRDPTADRALSARSSIEPSIEPFAQPTARPHTDPPTRPGRTDDGEPGRAV